MPFSLIPHRVFDHYGDITVQFLKDQGITLVLSDLDYTLAAKSTRRPDQALRNWIAELSAAGIKFVIICNNLHGFGRSLPGTCRKALYPRTEGRNGPSRNGPGSHRHAGRQTADGYAGRQPGRRIGPDGRTGGRGRNAVAKSTSRAAGAF